MSQFFVNQSGVTPPGTGIETVTGNSGGPVGPDGADNLNLLGDDSTVNNTNGITVIGDAGTNTETVTLTNRLTGTGTTVGATTADLVTFSLGAVAGAYNFELKVIGFNASTPASTGFTVLGTMRTDGATATIEAVPDETPIENVALITCDVDMIASVNNLIIRVLGVAGLTINWNVLATYVFIG